MSEQNQIVTFKSDGLVGGEQALREILVALNQSAGTGAAAEVRAGTPVFDSNGKLVRAEIVPPPDSNVTQIAEAINSNPGVAEVNTCFPQLQLNDLNPLGDPGGDGIVIGGGFPALTAGHTISVGTPKGTLGSLGISGYNDFLSLPSAEPIAISVRVGSPTAANLVIASGNTITLNHPGGARAYVFTKGFTLKPNAVGATVYNFYADDQGGLFVRFGSNATDSGVVFTEFPFESSYLVACNDPLRKFA